MAETSEGRGTLDSARLGLLLGELRAAHPELTAAAVATGSGLLLAAPQDEKQNAEALAAFGAALLSNADASSEALVGGAAQEAYARGPAGYVVALAAGSNVVLAALAAPTASLALLLPDLRQAATQIASATAV